MENESVLVLRRADIHPFSADKKFDDISLTDFRNSLNVLQKASLIIYLDESRFPSPTGIVLKSRWTGASGIIGFNARKEILVLKSRLNAESRLTEELTKSFEECDSKYKIASRVNWCLSIVMIGVLLWVLLS